MRKERLIGATVRMGFVVTVLLPALTVSGRAEIYQWVDRSGTVNYTEDPGKIPKKYRKKVKVVSDGGSPPAEIVEKPLEPSAAPREDKKVTLYGGKDGDAWKGEFMALRNEIRATEAELASRRGRIANPGNMSRGMYLGIQAEMRLLEDKLANLKGRLAVLEESAQRAGVPMELRK